MVCFELGGMAQVVFVHPMHAISAERAVAYEAQAIARCRRYGQEKTEPRLQSLKDFEGRYIKTRK